ncbi:NAD(P)H-quinone oxidoreductase subunit 1, chloroplastic [uncultured archaeon]|nr:NAD(P)H-quinone oxidoreductase subunit 1, chloroplastic [uncultured archaeon]
MISFFLFAIVNILVVLILAPFYISLIKKVKALFQGRKGPKLFQAYYNLLKLFKKESIYSTNSSFIMRVAPYINIICSIVAILFVPLLFIPDNYFGFGNIILFLYILALAKFFMALAGLDAGSTFGGMGSSREMSISSIIEPIVIIIFATLAFVYNSVNFFEIFGATSVGLVHASLWLLLIPLIIVLLTETARIPIDNPETHLELTMVHEAMILEQSGKNLALMELSSGVKQVLLMAIIINLFFPIGFNLPLSLIGIGTSLIAFLIKSIILAISIGIIESFIAKSRLFRLPIIFAIAFLLSLITLMMEMLL